MERVYILREHIAIKRVLCCKSQIFPTKKGIMDIALWLDLQLNNTTGMLTQNKSEKRRETYFSLHYGA
jgi:hypothetical protein